MSITDKYLQSYISAHLENSYEINYTEIPESLGLETYFYDELPNTEVKGYPLASDFAAPDGSVYSMTEYEKLSAVKKKECRLRYHFLPIEHEIYLGTTGSGKTTGCIEPQLRAISSQKNKPNIFVTDPKGELFNHNAEHMKKMGYRTFVLNFKNTTRSNKWNPLSDLLEVVRQIKGVRASSPEHCTGRIPDGVPKNAPSSAFVSGRYYMFDGKAFPTLAMAKQMKKMKENDLNVELSSLINSLGNTFIKVESTKDPTWEKAAQDQVKGFLQAMCDYLLDPFSGFTEDMFTIYTMTQLFNVLRRGMMRRSDSRSRPDVFTHPLIKNLPRQTQNMFASVFASSPITMLSHLSVLGNSLGPWCKPHIYALTTGNDIELFDEKDDSPFAIFVITRDYEASDYDIAALFVDWVYRNMVEHAEECEVKNKPYRVAGESFLNPFDLEALRDFNLFALVVVLLNQVLNHGEHNKGQLQQHKLFGFAERRYQKVLLRRLRLQDRAFSLCQTERRGRPAAVHGAAYAAEQAGFAHPGRHLQQAPVLPADKSALRAQLCGGGARGLSRISQRARLDGIHARHA